MSVYFVTGAGTDIGKTFVTALLLRQLRAKGRGALALKAHGVPLRSVILNQSLGSVVDLEATLASLRRHAPDHPILVVPRHAETIDLDLA